MRIAIIDKMARLRRREIESQRSGESGGSIDPSMRDDVETSSDATGECHDCRDHLQSCRCSPGEG